MAIIVGFAGNNPLLQGTTLDDAIFGNSLGNISGVAGNDRIFGLAGDDDITGDGVTILASGRGGNDVIYGGDGNDHIDGDASSTLYGVGGNDVIYGGAGSDDVHGDADTLAAGARGGNDRIYVLGGEAGGECFFDMIDAIGGNDLLDGSQATDRVLLYGEADDANLGGNSVGGNDILKGGAADDFLYGEGLQIYDATRCGNDQLWGNGGDDTIFGDGDGSLHDTASGGRDTLRGGAGNDELYGDGRALEDFAKGGNDRLVGGAGDDLMWGDGELIGADATGGRDRFVFSGNFGDDSILDFRTEDGDQLILQGLTQSEVQLSIVTVNAANDSTLITTLGEQSITLVGFTGSLTPGVDIVFA